mmetsp:Transcript_26822/g.25871  ORF Transcript_26822/g.25871 Transcript_26822/m.25871 type:complete len:172 (-) Transcript_26822:810-1325(-)
MNNDELNEHSEIFADDNLERIEQRCFFLMKGWTSNDPTIAIEVSLNAFAGPSVKQKVTLKLDINKILIEYCSEIFKNMTKVILQYKMLFNYGDLHNSPNDPILTTYKKCLQRQIEYQTSLYALKKVYLKKSWNVSDEAITNYQKKWYQLRDENKSKAEKKREEKEKDLALI